MYVWLCYFPYTSQFLQKLVSDRRWQPLISFSANDVRMLQRGPSR